MRITSKLVFLSLALVVVLCRAECDESYKPTHPELCEAAQDCLDLLDEDPAGECDSFPIAQAELPKPLRPEGYNLTLIVPGLYVYYDGSYYTLIARGGKEVLAVDFPRNPGTVKPDGSGSRMTDALEEVMGDDVPDKVMMLYSHGHFDHVGTAQLFYAYVKETLYPDAEIEVIGTAAAARGVARSVRNLAPNVTRVLPAEGETLSIGGELSLEVMVVGGHTDGDVLIYIPGEFVYLVDIVFPGWVPFRNFAFATDLRTSIAAHDAVLGLDFKVFNGGHMTRFGTREDVVISRNYTLNAIDFAVATLNTTDYGTIFTDFTDPDSPRFGDFWRLIGGEREANADTCFKRLVETYGCQLAGLAPFGRSHCIEAGVFVLAEQ